MKTASVVLLPVLALAAPAGTTNPFDPVWEIMTQPAGKDSNGCRGCHIGDKPNPPAPYFGSEECDVQDFLQNSDITAGGQDSTIARYLRKAIMPLGGLPWGEDQLHALYDWLESFSGGAEPGMPRSDYDLEGGPKLEENTYP